MGDDFNNFNSPEPDLAKYPGLLCGAGPGSGCYIPGDHQHPDSTVVHLPPRLSHYLCGRYHTARWLEVRGEWGQLQWLVG